MSKLLQKIGSINERRERFEASPALAAQAAPAETMPELFVAAPPETHLTTTLLERVARLENLRKQHFDKADDLSLLTIESELKRLIEGIATLESWDADDLQEAVDHATTQGEQTMREHYAMFRQICEKKYPDLLSPSKATRALKR